MTTIAVTDRTRIRRLSERQVFDREVLDALLDQAIVAHVAAVVDGRPLVVPMGFARDGDGILLHMSTGAGIALRRGGPLAVSVTEVDGLVYAATLYDSSMNYRSAVVTGVPTLLEDAEKEAALIVIADKLMPGRAAEVPANSRRELAGTCVLRVPIDDVSLKVRSGDPSEPDEVDPALWLGVLPVARGWDAPQAAAWVDSTVVAPPSVLARLRAR